MCSRKDYEAIAAMISKQRKQAAVFVDPQKTFATSMLDDLAVDFCEYFKRDNPRFDTVRFMAATLV